ncbi:MAG: signal transduction histidine kinase/CheY-like chemotaxis protein [Polaribacter sp.]|jgi:signal transduction histidine kinase/CheY-like chemotaxis protein
MRQIVHNYISILLVSLCFSSTYTSYSQDVKKDTIALIKEYQINSKNAITVQDFETAMINLNKASKLVANSKNNSLKTTIYLDIAELQFSLHNYDKAASETINAISLIKDLKNDKLLAESYLLYGSILTHKNDFKKAEQYLKEADDIFTNLNDEKNLAKNVLAFGILEFKKGNTKEAINYFEASKSLLINYQLPYQLALCSLLKSEALLNLEDSGINSLNFENAKVELVNAVTIIKFNNFTELDIESYKISSQVALRENQNKAAESLLSLYSKKKDSIYHIYLSIISRSFEDDSNVGDYIEIIANQQDDIDKKQKSIDLGKTTTGLSIALIIILSLLALSLFKNNNLRAKANDLLKDRTVELTLSKEKAERASLAKAQFLSTITHELRTPLYAVTGLTHLLLEEDPKPDQKEHLNSLKFSGEYLLSLINNILDLNKLEANKVEVEKTGFSLKKRINDVLVALKRTAEDRKNTLKLEYDDDIPEKLVGDPLKLSQVLINLIGNSVKFTQNGAVTVRIQKLEQSNNKVKLRVEIEDDGVGISKKKQKSIFETFSQGSLQINRKFGGSGLGLSIVKNLLELMNSKIYLESQLGQGSKFWFDIGFDVSEVQDDDNNTIYNIDYTALENASILVVEDNKINQMITKKILEKNKMVCQVADNGMDAIKLVKENNFEVILMDIHMPGISGVEATERIREFNKQIPILALTAVTIDENLDDFYKAGFNEIIPKPFKPEDFFEKIYRTLKASKLPVNG